MSSTESDRNHVAIVQHQHHHDVTRRYSLTNDTPTRVTRRSSDISIFGLTRISTIKLRLTLLLIGGCFLCYGFVVFAKSGVATQFIQWLSELNPEISCLVVLLCFFIVSLPFSWGYIVLNIGAGYLFGMRLGLALVIVGASLGAWLSTILCHYVCKSWIERQVNQNESLMSVKRVMQGHHAYNLVFLTRLTPIPFGLQNGLFSLVPIDHGRYVAYTALGLLPTQAVNTYMGTQLSDIAEILAGRKEMDLMTYMIYATQIVAGILLTTAVFYKAKVELYKATHNAGAIDNLELLDPEEADRV
eukprot:CFRG0135T1